MAQTETAALANAVGQRRGQKVPIHLCSGSVFQKRLHGFAQNLSKQNAFKLFSCLCNLAGSLAFSAAFSRDRPGATKSGVTLEIFIAIRGPDRLEGRQPSSSPERLPSYPGWISP